MKDASLKASSPDWPPMRCSPRHTAGCVTCGRTTTTMTMCDMRAIGGPEQEPLLQAQLRAGTYRQSKCRLVRGREQTSEIWSAMEARAQSPSPRADGAPSSPVITLLFSPRRKRQAQGRRAGRGSADRGAVRGTRYISWLCEQGAA